MVIGAIDPGKKGGWAIYDTGRHKPLVMAGRLDFDDPISLYIQFDDLSVEEVIIERAQASKQMGSSSAFEYGRGFGRVEAVLSLLSARPTIYYCAPSWWKAKLSVPTDKEKAVKKAIDIIPGLAKFVKLKSDDGVAEAALMGLILLDPKLRRGLIGNNEKRTAPKKARASYRR